MSYFALKIIISVTLILLISEIGKHSSLWGAILASLPLTSILAMLWLYAETKDVAAVVQLSNSIFWLVLPSLVLLITLPLLIQLQLNFYLALSLASLFTIIAYFLMIWLLNYFGIRL